MMLSRVAGSQAFAGVFSVALLLPAAAAAAPRVDGDIVVADNHVGKVVVLPDGIRLGFEVKKCLFGICPSFGVDVAVPNLLPPVNINSVLLTGRGRVAGDVVISGHVDGVLVVRSGSNINSVWSK